jgi:hypothetical protein
MTKDLSQDPLWKVLNHGNTKTYPCKCGGVCRRESYISRSAKIMSVKFKWVCEKCGKVGRH